MKKFIFVLPIILSYILLSAHFFRAGILYMTGLMLLLPLLLLIKKKISAIIIQIGLLFGTFVWVETFLKFMHIYNRFNMPFTKAGIIIAAVGVFTFLSIFLFRTKTLKDVYK